MPNQNTSIQLEFSYQIKAVPDTPGKRQIILECSLQEEDLHFAQGVERRVAGFAPLEARLTKAVADFFWEAENILFRALSGSVQIENQALGSAASPNPEPLQLPAKRRRRKPVRENKVVSEETVPARRRGRPRQIIPPASEITTMVTPSPTNQTQQTIPGMPKLLKKKAQES